MYYILGAIVVILIIWTVGSYLVVSSLEEPKYTLVSKTDNYEIRQYEPYLIAETEVRGNFNSSTNDGFRQIADYIFGNNTAQTKIAMTAPVLESQSEKIAMTVPVTTSLDESSNRSVSFVLPASYTLDTLPIPNNDKVKLVEIPERTVAALRFTWYATKSRVADKKAQLQQLLKKDELTTTGPAQVAQYNPPLSMPLTRRNEILIEVSKVNPGL
jgi:DNA gyrase inhibitor GyrI